MKKLTTTLLVACLGVFAEGGTLRCLPCWPENRNGREGCKSDADLSCSCTGTVSCADGTTYDEMRRQGLLALAEDARILAFVGENDCGTPDWNSRLGPQFVIEELNDAKNVFLASSEIVTTDVRPVKAHVVSALKRFGDDLLLILVNADEIKADVAVRSEYLPAELHLGGGRTAVPVVDGCLMLKLEAGESRVYRSRPWSFSPDEARLDIRVLEARRRKPGNLCSPGKFYTLEEHRQIKTGALEYAFPRIVASSSSDLCRGIRVFPHFLQDGFDDVLPRVAFQAWAPTEDDIKKGQPWVRAEFGGKKRFSRAILTLCRDEAGEQAINSGWLEANGKKIASFESVRQGKAIVDFDPIEAESLTFHPGPRNSKSDAAYLAEFEVYDNLPVDASELAVEAAKIEKILDEKFWDAEQGLMRSMLEWDFSPVRMPLPSDRRTIFVKNDTSDPAGHEAGENADMVMGEYLVALITKYRATGDREALEKARKMYDGLMLVYEMSRPGGIGFLCKPWGFSFTDETSSDQYVYMLTALDAYLPYARNAEEDARIRRTVADMADFWRLRDYNYKFFGDALPWQKNRFLSFMQLAYEMTGEVRFKSELERLLKLAEVEDFVPFSASMRMNTAHEKAVYGGEIYGVCGEAALSGWLSVYNLFGVENGECYARRVMPDFYEVARRAIADDGSAYQMLVKNGYGDYEEIDRREARISRAPRPEPWNWELWNIHGPLRGGGHLSASALDALVQMAPHYAPADDWVRRNATELLLKIAGSHLSYLEDPHNLVPKGVRWTSHLRSGDAFGFWLRAYWTLRERAARAPETSAVWISGRREEMNACYGFAAELMAKKGDRHVLRMSAASIARIWVNGAFAGYGPSRAAKGYMRMEEIDLTPFLKDGRNVLAVEVANDAVNQLYLRDQPAFFLAEVLKDGTEKVLCTGRDFKATSLPKVKRINRFSEQRGFAEFYEVSPASYAWRTDGIRGEGLPLETCRRLKGLERGAPTPNYAFDGSFKPTFRTSLRWDAARGIVKRTCLTTAGKTPLEGFKEEELDVNLAEVSQRLVVRERTPVNADEVEFRIREMEGVVFTSQFETAGFPHLELVCTKPATVYVTMDEYPDRDGLPNPVRFFNCYNCCGWKLLEPGTYTLECLQPNGLGCAHVMVKEGEVTLRRFDVRTYENPIPAKASLRASDPAVEKVFRAAARSLAHNAVDLPNDCPGRERGAYLGDTVFTGRGMDALLGDTSVERSFFENYVLAEDFGEHVPAGMLPMAYPADAHLDVPVWIPNFGMWSLVQLEEYVRRSSDVDLALRFRPRAEGLLDWFRQWRDADGLLRDIKGWTFVEWSQAQDYVKSVSYATNMTYIRFLDAFATLYGDVECAQEAERMRQTIRVKSFDGTWFRDNDKEPHCSEACQYFAFFSGVATKELYPELWNRLVHDFGPRRKDGAYPEICPANMLFGFCLRFDILTRAGLSAEVLEDVKALYLHQAEKTGTLWEATVPDDGYSADHGFPSVAAWLLMRDALGVKAIDRKCRTIRMSPPQGTPLEWCEGTIPVSEHEAVRVKWQIVENRVVCETVVPDGWRVLDEKGAVVTSRLSEGNHFAQWNWTRFDPTGIRLSPTGLVVERLASPTAVGVAKPRLSWRLPKDCRRQTAFEIDSGAWQSGKVSSSQSVDVLWDGKNLNPQQRVAWRVRIWNEKGEVSPWSEPSFFVMGPVDGKVTSSSGCGAAVAFCGARTFACSDNDLTRIVESAGADSCSVGSGCPNRPAGLSDGRCDDEGAIVDSAAWMRSLECWHHFGDRVALERAYLAVDHLLSPETASGYVASVHHLSARNAAAEMARILGRTSEYAVHTNVANRILRSMRAKYYKGRGRWHDGSQTAQSLAIVLDLNKDADERFEAARRLIDAVEEHKGHVDVGRAGARCLLRALSAAGRADLAVRLLANQSDRNRLAVDGDLLGWAMRHIAGLKVSDGGLKVTVAPETTCGLDWASGSVETPYGRIAVEWKVVKGLCELVVDVPPQVTAEVRLPDSRVETVGPGRRHYLVKTRLYQ